MGEIGLAFDPEFGDEAAVPSPLPTLRSELARAVRWLVLYPAAGFLGLVLAIGTVQRIVPMFTADRLNRPVAVKTIGAKELVLADGRRIPLRFLKRLPGDDAVFRSALIHGVEVDGRGEVFGLLTLWANCGMTLEPYHLTRVNLRDLAATAHPDCVDDRVVNAEELVMLKEWHSRPYQGTRRLWAYPLLSYCQHWHEALEREAGEP